MEEIGEGEEDEGEEVVVAGRLEAVDKVSFVCVTTSSGKDRDWLSLWSSSLGRWELDS